MLEFPPTTSAITEPPAITPPVTFLLPPPGILYRARHQDDPVPGETAVDVQIPVYKQNAASSGATGQFDVRVIGAVMCVVIDDILHGAGGGYDKSEGNVGVPQDIPVWVALTTLYV